MAVDMVKHAPRSLERRLTLLHHMVRRLWWANVILGVLLVLSIGFNVSYTNTVDRRSRHDTQVASEKSNRRWCDLLRTLDLAYNNPDQSSPPTTELGRRIAAAVHDLKTGFGC